MSLRARPKLDFERYLLRLRFHRPARFRHFLHGGVIHGLFGNALKTRQIPEGLVPVVPESGRCAYEPGDAYHVGVVLVGEDRAVLPDLLAGIREIGVSSDRIGRVPLGGNFELESAQALDPPDFDAETAAVEAAGADIGLRFVSPLRLKHPVGYFDRERFPVGLFLDRLWRRLFRSTHGRWPGQDDARSGIPDLPAESDAEGSSLLWIDLPHHARERTLGGVLGRVALRGISADWAPWIALARHINVGSTVHFGFGRFVLGELDELERPARWLYDHLADPQLLEKALDHVAEHSVAGGVDHVSPERFADERADRLPVLLEGARTRSLRASPLLGLPIRRPGKDKLRPLTIPTVGDRVLQRTAAQVMGPAIDTLFEDCSFAYRRGFSRAGAARAIQEAYRDGFRIVLDADISAFFEEVRWDRLFAMLDALFPDEPLLDLVERWVTAPVVFDGLELQRCGGLPQGAPISPLLANLYLDELDDAVLGNDFRLVRYADDFVVLCRDLESAERARSTVESALADLGLELNTEETSVRSLDDGLDYLGYLFCRSLVLEPLRSETDDAPPAGEPRVPARSWLARVPIDRVRALLDKREGKRVEAVPIGGERADQRALYVVSPQSRVYLREGRLHVESEDGSTLRAPIRHLSHVVVLGRSRITVPVLLSLDNLGVPVYFCRRNGELRARWEPHAPEWSLWLAQARCLENTGTCLEFAREIVRTKLANQATLLVRHRFQGARTKAVRIRELASSAGEATSPEALRGFEGAGARLYFETVAAEFAEAWGFERRRRRPPPDPVNALLSFTYTLLHHHVSTALVCAGLNPRLGLFHRPRGAHHALASDLQEELRFLADSVVWAMLRRREIRQEHFVHAPKAKYPYLLKPDPRRKVIAKFEDRLMTEVELPGESSRTWREVIDRQAQRLRTFVLAPENNPYHPIRAPG